MNLIYYFTGTGNSLQIANDLSCGLDNSNVRKISEYKGEYINSNTLGIVFPVYCLGLPLIVSNFLNKLNVANNTYVYVVANCAKMEGMVLQQCNNILSKRKINLSSGFVIHMPGNYIVLYNVIPEKKQKELFAKEFIKVTEIIEIVNNRSNIEIKKANFLNTILHKLIYKNGISSFPKGDKYFSASDSCNSCKLCVSRCSVNNITMIRNKPKWNHKCQMCFSCINSCPTKAIDYQARTKKRNRYLNPNVKL